MKTIDLTTGILPPKTYLPWYFSFIGDAVAIYQRLFSPEKGLKVTSESVVDIIKKGKESGVDEMTIKVNQDVGLSLKGLNIDGVKLNFVIGNSGEMNIIVKYK